MDLLQVVPAVLGLGIAILVSANRRFGAGSWLLSLYLLMPALGFGLSAFSDGTLLSSEADAIRAFVALILSLPFCAAFLWTIDRPDYVAVLKKRWPALLGITVPAPGIVAIIYTHRPDQSSLAEGFVSIGPGGYLGAIYGLVISVLILAGIEQIVRTADQTARWQVKFLLLGIAGCCAALIYLDSRILLFKVSHALMPLASLQIYPPIYGLASVLIFISWRRSTGKAPVIALSHRAVYSSITLLTVGIYLIVSSLLARWVGQFTGAGIQTEALVYLIAGLVLGALILGTELQQRIRSWLRRNIFSGSYDYRTYWMEATEHVRSTETREQVASALSRIVQEALGAIDVTVWVRETKPDRLDMIGSLGSPYPSRTCDLDSMLSELLQLGATARVAEIESERIASLGRCLRAELLVPLLSSGRLVGILTVGSDRSGRPYGPEAREFLRVLGTHAAAEFHKHDLLASLVEGKEMEAFRTFSTFLLHDLKNFASTLSLISRNSAKHREDPVFLEDAFQSVYDTAEKMKRLCNSLKTFSGNLAANRKLQDINQLITGIADNMSGALGDSLRLELEEIPCAAIDPEEIGRVIQNLLLNAKEAIGAQGRVTVRTVPVNGEVQITVSDNGRGISRQFLEEKLFHPFQTTKSDGLGIGLFQCKKIVDAHGGEIEVRSELGKGTEVKIRLTADLRGNNG